MLKAGQIGGPTPAQMGWTTVSTTTSACSVMACQHAAVCAIQRHASKGGRLQYYCEAHAHARGVDRVHELKGMLVWSPEFLAARGASPRATW